MAQHFESVEEYISRFPLEVQTVLQNSAENHPGCGTCRAGIDQLCNSDLQRRRSAGRLPCWPEEAHQHLPHARTRRESRTATSALEGKFLGAWRRSGAYIARPTREGYRVVSRPRRTPRGACRGAAKRQEISLPGHYLRISPEREQSGFGWKSRSPTS